MYVRPHKTTFSELARNKRRPIVHRVKRDIDRAAPLQQGIFFSRDYVHGHNEWVDVLFLSIKDKFVFYNAAIQTLKHSYKELCSDKAYDLADELVKTKHYFESIPGSTNKLLKSSPDKDELLWDGLSWRGFIRREERRLADSGTITVKPCVEQKFDYRFGIGLVACLPYDYLSIDNICEFIEHYWSVGEPKKIESSKEYSFKNDEIEWGIFSNEICDPEEQIRIFSEKGQDLPAR